MARFADVSIKPVPPKRHNPSYIIIGYEQGERAMPFGNDVRRPFTQPEVEGLNRNQMGVYGLYVAGGDWVYIGSGDIRDRLLAHLGSDNACIMRERPTNWMAEVTANYVAREKELIIEYNPICNRRVG